MTSRLLIEGMMPYRALNRLQREGICVKNVKKRKKNQLICMVDAKEVEKIFAIYPNMCYNGGKYVAYTVRLLPPKGVQKWWNILKNRVGLWLGAALFVVMTALSNEYVLRIDVIGDCGYEEDVSRILQENGVALFQRYDGENSDLLTAEILRLQGVSFCSLQKIGCTLVVEVRTSPFAGE